MNISKECSAPPTAVADRPLAPVRSWLGPRYPGLVAVRGSRVLATVAVVLAASFLTTGARAEAADGVGQDTQEVTELRRRVEELERQLLALQTSFERRLAAVEEQIAALRAGRQEAAQTAPAPSTEAVSGEERAELERELAAILGETGGTGGGATPPTQSAGQRFGSRTRTLTELNPEISVTGDVFGTVADRTGDPEANQFRFTSFEVSLQAPLDPFSLAKAFVVQEEGEVSVEEAYVDWTALPGGIGVKAGEMRLDWGKINRWHQHALPQADRPFVHQAVWGEEGLLGLGASLSWLPPSFLGDYNEIWVQVVNDQNDVSFSGRGFDQPVFLIHETNYWDLSDATYFELGLSGATGVNDELGTNRTNVWGIDWNLTWSPPARALYRNFELRGELMLQQRETPDLGTIDSWGAYTYGTWKLDRNWFIGARGDWTELPEEPGESLWGVSPYVEWWQSEWVRFRLQYSHNSRLLEEPESENRFIFQLTWALGPHKHEKY